MITRREALAGTAAAALSSASVARAEVQPDGLRGALDANLEGLTPAAGREKQRIALRFRLPQRLRE